MAAKLIRTEKTSWGATHYVLECSVCGGEYYKWQYNKRTSCICSKCAEKRNYEQTKAREQRKQQDRINKVLEDIKAEIEKIDIYGHIDMNTAFIRDGQCVKNLALEIINKHIGGAE